MKIALIYPPFKHKLFSENLKVVDEEFCLAPPIILGYVAAILERWGHNVMLIDANASGLSKEEALKLLLSFRPDILGFRLENYHFHTTMEWMTFLKNRLQIPVLIGGIAMTLYPYEVMGYPQIDYAVIGDAIETLPLLLRSLEEKKDLTTLPGVGFRKDGNIKINFPNNELIDFNIYPFPARHLLPNHLYYSIISQRKNFTIMVTMRGCPFGCTFCAIRRIPYQQREVDNIIREIEQCYYDFSIREIDFFDATFFLNKEKVIRLCREIKKRKLKIEWSCRTRVDIVDGEILREASESGCRQIYYGIESGSPHILKKINKQIDPILIRKAIRLSKNYGIRTMGFFMVGNPGEKKADILKTINFSKELGLDFIQVCRTIAKPNSDLNDMAINRRGIDFWREYIVNKNLENYKDQCWVELSQAEIGNYLRKFYYSFYFRPHHILKLILRIRSIEELLRYCRVGLKMLFKIKFRDE